MKANDKQVGGNHYQTPSKVQHWDIILRTFGPGYHIGCATKYLLRWKKKNGLEDLKKAQHFVEKLIEWSDGFTKLDLSDWKPFISLQSFCDLILENNVGSLETKAISLLLDFESTNSFKDAAVLIEKLINEEQSKSKKDQQNPFGFDEKLDVR